MDTDLVIALGIDNHIDNFAFDRSAATWKRLVMANPGDWKFEFLRYLGDDTVRFCFNLTAINVELGISLASSGNPSTFRWTDWELLKIKESRRVGFGYHGGRTGSRSTILSSRVDQGGFVSFSSNRVFKIWDFQVGHNQLLLRSPESPSIAGNVDVIFVGVDYFDIPTRIDGLEFVEPTDAELSRFEAQISREHRTSKAFCLASRNLRYFVVGVAYWVVENNLDTWISSLETPGVGRPPGAIDRVLDQSLPIQASHATV